MNKKLLITLCTFIFGSLVFLTPIMMVSATTTQPTVEEMSKPADTSVQCRSGNFCPNVTVGSFKAGTAGQAISGKMLGDYIQSWYTLIISIVGIIATVMLMWGGMKWLTSRGNSGTISDAKDIIWSAIIGLVLTLLSWTILYLINPKLLEMQDISLANITYKGSVDTIINALREGKNVINDGMYYQPNPVLNTINAGIPPGNYSAEQMQQFQQQCTDLCSGTNNSEGRLSGNYDQGFSCGCFDTANGTGLPTSPTLTPEQPTVPPITDVIPGIQATPNRNGEGYTMTWNDMNNETYYNAVVGQAQLEGYTIEDHRNSNPPYVVITPQDTPGSVFIPNNP